MEVVLMNPNIASVQTNMDDKSASKADHVFFLPVTPDFVEEIIKKHKFSLISEPFLDTFLKTG